MAVPGLVGRRIVVPESRELDLFTRMIEAEGAVTLRCPLVKIRDVEDPAPVALWLERLVRGDFADLVLLTGEGLRRLMSLAGSHGMAAEAVAALGRLRTITRGPKPGRALRELGLAATLPARRPTTEGVIETLADLDLAGRAVGVQLYPGNPNALLLDFLRSKGADPIPVLPYRYASDTETGAVEAIIREMAAGQVDLIAFTSTPQLQRLQQVAEERGLQAALAQGLARTRIAAVGPVVAAALAAIGAPATIMPEGTFFMKPLVSAIRAAFADQLPAERQVP